MTCGILIPQSGIEPVPAALENGLLTTSPPGKSLPYLIDICIFSISSTSRAQVSVK